MRTLIHTLLSLAGLLSTLPAQFCRPVKYGDPVVMDSITKPRQTKCYSLKGGRKNEIVRISLASGSHFAQLALFQGSKSIGSLAGTMIRDFKLPADGDCRLDVAARDGHSSNWFHFQIDRVNDPVNAERVCYGWNVQGSIQHPAQFLIYRIGALAGKKAVLGISSGSHFGRAEVIAPDGRLVCAVEGTGSVPCTFATSGLHSIVVRARDLHSGNWFAIDLRCQTWPCECTADRGNFGRGWPGKTGVPTLTADRTPQLGSTVTIGFGNSSGLKTLGFALLGLQPANVKTALGGFLLLEPSGVLQLSLPPRGIGLPLFVPNDRSLCSLCLIVQSVQADAKATNGWAFSRALRLLIGR